jgi:hypothetical protein
MQMTWLTLCDEPGKPPNAPSSLAFRSSAARSATCPGKSWGLPGSGRRGPAPADPASCNRSAGLGPAPNRPCHTLAASSQGLAGKQCQRHECDQRHTSGRARRPPGRHCINLWRRDCARPPRAQHLAVGRGTECGSPATCYGPSSRAFRRVAAVPDVTALLVVHSYVPSALLRTVPDAPERGVVAECPCAWHPAREQRLEIEAATRGTGT